MSNKDCKASPKCANYNCEKCSSNDDCYFQKLNSLEVCNKDTGENCTKNDDCQNFGISWCRNNKCEKCISDIDCSQFEFYPFCGSKGCSSISIDIQSSAHQFSIDEDIIVNFSIKSSNSKEEYDISFDPINVQYKEEINQIIIPSLRSQNIFSENIKLMTIVKNGLEEL